MLFLVALSLLGLAQPVYAAPIPVFSVPDASSVPKGYRYDILGTIVTDNPDFPEGKIYAAINLKTEQFSGLLTTSEKKGKEPRFHTEEQLRKLHAVEKRGLVITFTVVQAQTGAGFTRDKGGIIHLYFRGSVDGSNWIHKQANVGPDQDKIWRVQCGSEICTKVKINFKGSMVPQTVNLE